MIDTEVHIGRFLNDVWNESHLESIWEAGITEAWCSSLSSGTVGMRFGNDELLEIVNRESRLKGLAWVVPYDPDWKAIARDCLQAGCIGIKIHPPMDRWEPTEAFLAPILELAGEFGVPVFMHAHGLNLIDAYLAKYSSIQLVVYHVGAFEGLWLATRHGNVWPGLSWCDHQKISAAISCVGAHRLLYGTDSPISVVPNPVIDLQGGKYRQYRDMLLTILDRLDLDEPSKFAICSGNARRLLEAAKSPSIVIN